MNDVKIIKAAYVTLLAQGRFAGRATLEGQALLGSMRDRIAEAEERDPEEVQIGCENMARGHDASAVVRMIVRDLGILGMEEGL